MRPSVSQADKDRQKQLALEVRVANERIHSLVVKIISWRAGLLDGAAIVKSNKITKQEWKRYRAHLMSISKIDSSEKIKTKLDETYQAIQNNGGFE